MKTILFTLALLSAPALADVTIIKNNVTKTVDCAKNPNVSVMGNHAKVTLKGVCASVNVAGNHAKVIGSAKAVSLPGNHNTATLDAVDDLSVPGNHNTATWKKTVDTKLAAPRISAPGNDNSVTQAK